MTACRNFTEVGNGTGWMPGHHGELLVRKPRRHGHWNAAEAARQERRQADRFGVVRSEDADKAFASNGNTLAAQLRGRVQIVKVYDRRGKVVGTRALIHRPGERALVGAALSAFMRRRTRE